VTRTETIKRDLKRSGATYTDVARLADVTWRMVHYVVHGQRTSAKVMDAIARLTVKR
jgi:hypothetical protein